jgi:hypothetical protein
MKSTPLTAQFRAEIDCPKEVLMWNYYDHEHLVGTQYKRYNAIRVLLERDGWSLVLGGGSMSLFPLYSSGISFQHMEGNTMKSFQQGCIGFMLETETLFEDLANDRCTVTVTYRIKTHPMFKLFDPFFQKLFKKWFWATWEEDVPMHLRRWKVHQLGFKDFSGIEYINEKLPRPQHIEPGKYEFVPPIKNSSATRNQEGIEGPCDSSVGLGSADS